MASPRRLPKCTGIAATWCPVCGDCTCPVAESVFDQSVERLIDDEHADPNCPLHGPRSFHAGTTEPYRDVVNRPHVLTGADEETLTALLAGRRTLESPS